MIKPAPADWRRVRLGDVVQIFGGGTPSRSVQENWDGDILWATPSDLTRLHGRYIAKTESSLSRIGLAASAATVLPAGSVLMTSRATIGACAINSVPMATNQGFQSLVPGPGANAEFLLYWIRGRTPELLRLASGSTFLEVSRRSVADLSVLLPTLSEQGKIADVLSSVDDAMEATQAVVRQLQVVGKAMLADFLARGLPGRHTCFTQTTIGEVPESWETVPLRALANIQHGYAFEGRYFCEAAVRDILLTPVNFAVGGGFRGERLKYYEGPVEDRYVLEPGQVVVTMTDLSKAGDTLGYSAVLPKIDGHRFLHNQRIGRVEVLREDVNPAFLALAMTTEPYRKHILSTASGTTVRHTSPSRVLDAWIALPPLAEQDEIVAVFASHKEVEFNNLRWLRVLEEARTALMHALLTGELRVTHDEPTL